MRRAGADGQVDGDRLAVEPLADFVERAEEIGPFAVHLVNQRDPRHAVFVGLMPDGFALGLDAFAGAEHHDAAVEHAQAPLDFGGEIDVAGRVDQIDLNVFPRERDRGGVDRDAAFLLLGIVVGDGGAFIDRADAVAEPAVEQHPFGDGGLARVDVGDDADVAKVVDVGHGGELSRVAESAPLSRSFCLRNSSEHAAFSTLADFINLRRESASNFTIWEAAKIEDDLTCKIMNRRFPDWRNLTAAIFKPSIHVASPIYFRILLEFNLSFETPELITSN